jgi:hypothetical protein
VNLVYRYRVIEQIRCLESRGGVDSSRGGGGGKGRGDSIIVVSSGFNPSPVLLQRDRAIGGPIATGYQTAPQGAVESSRSLLLPNRD